jgi:hypothetical protein
MVKLILLFGFIFSICGCTHLKYLNAFDGHYGSPKIKESRIYHFSGTGEASTEKLAGRNVYYYDRKGRKEKHLIYRGNESKVSGWLNYHYDKAGNVVEVIIFDADSNINVSNKYSYNRYGQQIFREYVSGNSRTITKTEYDREKRKAIKIGIINDSVFHEKSIIFYDYKWRDIEIQSFNKRDNMERRIEKVYDNIGNEILSQWVDSTNRMYEFHKFFFDSRKNKTKIENYRINNNDTSLAQTTRFEYKYDEKGNVVYEMLISNGNKLRITRNSFKY